MPPSDTEHICVCVCTYKRPDLLGRSLQELARQYTDGLFTYSIVVVDNDQLESAKTVVEDFAANSAIPVKYCVEPRQNIALARNMAVANADGDFVAFIDDDEIPSYTWLLTLFKSCRQYGVDGVLGPVKPYFEDQPPAWVIAGGFYNRATYPTGFVIDWSKGRTGNVLLKKEVFRAVDVPFRPEFRSGEDQDFFRRVIEKGYVFIWCDEAVAHELVPPIRWQRGFMLRRAMLQGTMWLSPPFGALGIAKSMVAAVLYVGALPFALAAGQHRFMSVSVKLFYHLGKLLAGVGINPIKAQYVTH